MRYAVEYHDKQGNGWTRLVEASDLKEVISITKVDPDVCRIKSILPHHLPVINADLPHRDR